MYARPLKYFSTFSGIGGFELGIGRAFSHQSTDAQSGSAVIDAAVRLQERQALQELSRHERRQRNFNKEGRGVLSTDFGGKRAVRGTARCVGFSEIDKYAVKIYQSHFPEHTNYGDITKLDADALPDFDLFVGGFPCQAFSIAGLRKGFADTRGTLFFDIARILDARRPTRFVLENVKGLLSHDNGRTFKTIVTALVELGYGVEWQVLNSKDFGVPQNRERVFIVGHLGVEPGPQVFPFTYDDEISHRPAEAEQARPQTEISHTLRGSSIKADQTFIGAINRGEFKHTENALTIPASYYKGHDNHGARPMLLDNMEIRRLTPVECERLQGFPDGWTEGVSDTQRYKCLGNAVTVNVIEAIMRKLYGDNYGLPTTEGSTGPTDRIGA